MNNSKKLVHFEISRALCMIWIVGIWHGRAYINGFPELNSLFWNDLTEGVLSTFVFLSGYLLGNKRMTSKKDVIAFYKRRFFSLYIPFFVACVLMYAMFHLWGALLLYSVKQLVLSLLGLSLIVQPAPSTLWFVVMLILYYLITPVMLKYRGIHVKAAFILGMLVFRELMSRVGCQIDERLVWYFPIYCLGLQYAGRIDSEFKFSIFVVLVLFIWITQFLGIHIRENSIYNYLIVIMFVNLIIETGKLLEKNSLIARIGVFLGGISMWAYLFHRHVFHTCMVILGNISIVEMYTIIVPLLIIIVFALKCIYTRVMQLLMKG